MLEKTLSMRIPCGVPGLDEILRGGFPRGSIVLVTGSPGTGKSTLAAQFLFKGLEDGNEAVLVDTCHSMENMSEMAKDFGWDQKLLNKIRVLDCFNFQIGEKDANSVDMTSFAEVTVMINELLSTRRGPIEHGARLVVDSFTDFILYNSLERSLRFLQALKTNLKRYHSNMVSTMLLLESGVLDEKHIQSIEYVADATIRMVGDDKGRYLMVSRMRATPTRYSWVPIRITNGVTVDLA